MSKKLVIKEPKKHLESAKDSLESPYSLPVTISHASGLKSPKKRITRADKEMYLKVFAQTGNKTHAAEKTGFTRTAFDELLINDTRFAERFNHIKVGFSDLVETNLLALSLESTPRTHADRKLWLQSNKPEKYSPRKSVDHTHRHVHAHVNMDSLKQILTNHHLGEEIERADIPETIPFKVAKDD